MTLAHILCPVDFSEVSAHALEQATVVAGWYHAKITVLYVYTPALPTVSESFGVSMPADRVEPAKIQRLQETARSFAGPAIEAKREVDVIVDIGHPAQQILARASALGADMIVMGTHGASGFQHFMLGSVTEKVLRKASCPVLTMPPRAHAPASLPFTRILCPIDFSNPSLSALEWTWSLAQESQAAVTLLHVIEWPWEEPPAPHLEELPAHEAQKLAEFRRELETTSLAKLESLVPLDRRARRLGGIPHQAWQGAPRSARGGRCLPGRPDRDGCPRPQRHRSIVVRLDDKPCCARRLVPGPDGPRETVTR